MSLYSSPNPTQHKAAIAAIGPKPKLSALRKVFFPEQFVDVGRAQHARLSTADADQAFFVPPPFHVTRPSETYSQFTQTFARSYRQPLFSTERVCGPVATVHIVPIGITPQQPGCAQQIVLRAIQNYVSAILHPLQVNTAWLKELDAHNARFMIQQGRLNVYNVMDLVERKFGLGNAAGTDNNKTWVICLSPIPLSRPDAASTAHLTVVELPKWTEIIRGVSSTPASTSTSASPSDDQIPEPALSHLQQWVATLGQRSLQWLVGLTNDCTWFRCRLNPPTLLQTCSAPVAFCWHLCPVCLRKFGLAMGITGRADAFVRRYALLKECYSRMRATNAACWVADRVAEITGEQSQQTRRREPKQPLANSTDAPADELSTLLHQADVSKTLRYGDILKVRTHFVRN